MALDSLGDGLGPTPLGSSGAGSLVAFSHEVYESPTLDLTQTVSNVEIIPAKPGHVAAFVTGDAFWVIESVAGTQVTPPTIQMGSNAAHTNYIPSSAATPPNADVNAATPPSISTFPTAAGNTVQRLANTPVFLDITAGASGTGGYACRARLSVLVRWMPSE